MNKKLMAADILTELTKVTKEYPNVRFSQLINLIYGNIKDISSVSDDITLKLIKELRAEENDFLSKKEIDALLGCFTTFKPTKKYDEGDILSQSEIDDIREGYSHKQLDSDNKTVLIIDDAAFMRMMLRDIFIKSGYEVIGEAENGETGLKKFVELEPDITVVDIAMPVLDGISVIKRIVDSSTYILVCSAMNTYGIVKECFDAGADDFVMKPFSSERLLQRK